MRKIIALVVATLMVAMMAISAVFAQTETYTSGSVAGVPAGSGSITIQNAAKGETYAIYKLFDATLGESGSNAIAYTGEIPDELKDYFEYTYSGSEYIKAKSGTTLDNTSDGPFGEWLDGKTALLSVVSDGSALKFANLPYGYYVVTTTQGQALLSITSTDPDAEIYDKNTTTITVAKEVSGTSFSIGQTIPYTATFNTTNYIGEGEAAEQVYKYVISDTLPEFLSNVQITSVKIYAPAQEGLGEELKDLTNDYKENGFGTEKQITIPWATKDTSGTWTSLYQNGAVIVIKYTGVLTQVVKFDDPNKNTVSIDPFGKPSSGTPSGSPLSGSMHDDADIFTYGAALKKVDGETKKTLAGAEFQIEGLQAREVGSGTGVYVVVTTSGTTSTLKVNASGSLYILGLASGTYNIVETKAPDGYNILEDPAELPTQVLGHVYTEVSGSWYVDEDGNRTETKSSGTTVVTSGSYTDLLPHAFEVENNAGTLLPSTGGIGTTIFYIVGGLLAVGAGVVLVAKKRMGKVED